MNITAILFDLDGTLLDSLPGIQFSADEAVRAVLHEEKAPDLRPLIGPPIRSIFEKAFPRLLPETIGALESRFRESYDREGFRKGSLYPAVRSTLASLSRAGVSIFLVTNKPSAAAGRILAHTGISGYFREAVSPDSAQPPYRGKGEMASGLVRKFSLAPGRTLLVGDSADDRKAAEHCGLRFGAAAYGYGGAHLSPPGPPALVLRAISDLPGAIREKGGTAAKGRRQAWT